MKRLFKLLILLGALAVLGAAYLLIVKLMDDKQPSGPTSDTSAEQIETSYTAARIDINSMYALKYDHEGETYSFSLSLDETCWCWLENKELPLDNTYFAAMATALREVVTDLKIKITDTELETYGLDAPWLSITVSDNVYGTQTFSFGKLNSFTGQYYFLSSADSNTVYLVPSDLPDSFAYTPYEMVSNDSLPAIDDGSITSIHISSPAEDTLYSCHTDEGLDAWYVSQGGEEETAVSEELAAELGSVLSGVTFSKPVGFTEDERSACGLSEPTTVTISYTATSTVTDSQSGASYDMAIDKEFVLLLGYADSDGGVYAGIPGSVLCYRIDSSVWQQLCSMITKPNWSVS